MIFGEKSKEALAKRIQTEINEEVLNNYWKGYKMVPFALYDDKKIYLANHYYPPSDFNKVENICIGPWRQEFIANTMITFEGEEMGIVNLDMISPTSSYETLYSITVHEMFHGYQNKKGFLDKIQYSEFMFMKYPFTKENIALRVIERQELLKAVFAQDIKQKENHLGKFIGAREKRSALIGESIKYELGLESIEGTATYVEYKAYLHKTPLPYEFVLSKFTDNLAGYPENFNSFRHSCYSPGMLICLTLDQFNLDWQEEYMNSGKLLYEFFLEKISVPKEDTNLLDSVKDQALDQAQDQEQAQDSKLQIAEYLANTEAKRRKVSVDNFLNSEGYKIVLNGSMGMAGFNPMQVVPYENQILHQTFLGIKINSQTFFIKGESLSKQGQMPWNFQEVIFFRTERPTIADGNITIDGVGVLKGDVKVKGNVYYVTV